MRTTCTECGGTEYARGLCSKHYQRARLHGNLPDVAPRQCEHCGALFIRKYRNARYCSPACKDAARAKACREATVAEAGDRRCLNCRVPIPPSVTLKAKFCSNQCGWTWHNDQAKQERLASKAGRICDGCSGPMPAELPAFARYCSTPCRMRSRRHEAYGLTKAELDLLLAQHEQCAICQASEWGRKGPQVDHDHVTGAVRGVLCINCNNGLGRFGDDPARLRAAAEYLERVRA